MSQLNQDQASKIIDNLGGVEVRMDDVMPDTWKLAPAVTMLVESCHSASANAGWWGERNTRLPYTKEFIPDDIGQVRANSRLGKLLVTQKLCLVHSEISEAMEGHRKGLMDDKLPHRPMVEVELADAVIRIADLAGAIGLDLGGAIAEKLAFNAHRPDHKPEARAAAGGKAY